MEIVLSLNMKAVLATSAADVRMLAEGCESLPYTMRALALYSYMPDGGLANRLRSRLLCAQECMEAINKEER
nr:MAG TPA: hypothetical protein [Caudoviricetes sp.]